MPVTAASVERAIDGVRDHALSFWDALIWATAAEADATYILTEDCQHGRRVEGVLYLDPFDHAFELASLTP
jgi:predicted nucleic acid-binding protein